MEISVSLHNVQIQKIVKMKKNLMMVFVLVLFGGLLLTPSCKVTDPTFGTLSVTVFDPHTGYTIPNELVFLASSLENLKNGIYITTGWTNAIGQIYFGNLPPAYYYYDTADWEDYGGAQVYAGIDHYVTLYVNTPQIPGK
jgi:hypothetical protein